MAEIRRYHDLPALSEAAAELFIECAQVAASRGEPFGVALSGGGTPEPFFRLMGQEGYARQVDWAGVHLFWGDERMVPLDHPDSNYRMAKRAWVDHVPIPQQNVHPIQGGQAPAQAAEAYRRELGRFFEMRGRTGLDWALMGLGADGHTASLFPESALVRRAISGPPPEWAEADFVKSLRAHRVSLSPSLFNASQRVVFLVAGAGKAPAVSRVLEGPYDPLHLPSQLIAPRSGRLIWMLDEAAAASLTAAPVGEGTPGRV